jgi:hypothetical protein
MFKAFRGTNFTNCCIHSFVILSTLHHQARASSLFQNAANGGAKESSANALSWKAWLLTARPDGREWLLLPSALLLTKSGTNCISHCFDTLLLYYSVYSCAASRY